MLPLTKKIFGIRVFKIKKQLASSCKQCNLLFTPLLSPDEFTPKRHLKPAISFAVYGVSAARGIYDY